MREVSATTTYTVKEFTNIIMEINSMASLAKVKGMVWDYSRGWTVDIKRANGLMINFRFDWTIYESKINWLILRLIYFIYMALS